MSKYPPQERGHDPERLVAYYRELQDKYRDRFVVAPTKRHDDE